MNVQNHIAVIRHHALTPDRLAAEPHQLACDVGARHRHYLDRQGEAGTEHLDQLAVVDDADELLRRGGEYLLAGEGGSPSLDEDSVRCRGVGAVDVEPQIALRVQIQDRNPRDAQGVGGLIRTRDGALELDFAVFQHFDELIHRGAGADAEHHAFFDVLQRSFGCAALFFG